MIYSAGIKQISDIVATARSNTNNNFNSHPDFYTEEFLNPNLRDWENGTEWQVVIIRYVYTFLTQ